jgi:hypothetical protein
MAIADWSGRRLATIWAIGLVLEVLLYFGFNAYMKWTVLREARETLREAEILLAHFPDQKAREDTMRLADSVSRAAQRYWAIEQGRFSVTPAGDTVVAVVGMSERLASDTAMIADPVAIRARQRELVRQVVRKWMIMGFVWLGPIPLALIALTAAWRLTSSERPPALSPS